MISVCMATFDGARFVHQQVATILEQLEPGDELVVSDDSSTDDTVAIVRAFGDERESAMLEGSAFRSPLLNFEHAVRHAEGTPSCWPIRTTSGSRTSCRSSGSCSLVRRPRPYLVVLDAEVVDEDERVALALGAGEAPCRARIAKNIWANRYLGCCMAFSRDLLDGRCRSRPGSACTTSGWASCASGSGRPRSSR